MTVADKRTPTTSISKPTVVSLFSGAGGFDWGFHNAGFQTRLAYEMLEDASKTLARNLRLTTVPTTSQYDPTTRTVVHGDVRQADFGVISLNPDVLIGGPPCQDFSLSQGQQRLGLNGGRGRLYVEFVRAVMFLQPKVFVFENVPGLISANDGLAYKTILSDLENLEEERREVLKSSTKYQVPMSPVEGYTILYNGVVDAQRLGIPQTRKRLIIIGLRKDAASRLSAHKLRGIRQHLVHNLAGKNMLLAKYPMTCLEVFEGKPLSDLETEYTRVMKEYSGILEPPMRPVVAEWKQHVWSKLKFKIVEDYFLANQITNGSNSNKKEFEQAMRQHADLLSHLGWQGHPVNQLAISDGTNNPPKQSKNVRERMNHIPPDENYSFVDGTEWAVEGKGISFIYRRSAPLKPAWTVMAYGGGGTYGYHFARSRGQLTLRERARIQTFTDDFLFEGSGSEIRAQIGEAVPPLLGERIGCLVAEVLDSTAN